MNIAGTVKVTISKKKYEFHFGMHAADIYQRHASLHMGAVGIIGTLFFAGLKAREEKNKLPEGFGLKDVYDLWDAMSEADYEKVKAAGYEALGFMQKITAEVMPKVFTEAVEEASKSPKKESAQ